MRIGKKISSFLLLISISLLTSMIIFPSGSCFEMTWNFRAGDWIRDAAISDDGSTIAACSYDHKMYLFNSENNIPLWVYDSSDTPWIAALSTKGENIIAGSSSGYIRLFTKDSSVPLWSYKTGATVGALAITPDGSYMVYV